MCGLQLVIDNEDGGRGDRSDRMKVKKFALTIKAPPNPLWILFLHLLLRAYLTGDCFRTYRMACLVLAIGPELQKSRSHVERRATLLILIYYWSVTYARAPFC